MAVPLLDIRVNFDRLGLSRLANDGFETDTAGWSVAAGIQSLATSITRTVSAPYMGVAVGRLVTTATSGSGAKYVMASTFTSGRTYRFRVYLKSISGTTSALIRIGSLGTVGDQATATMTLTTSWAAYTVDFTPSGNRTDIEVDVCTNAAAIMTADIDDAEVYDLTDDLTTDADALSTSVGANFEGGVAAGQATLTLRNDTNQWTDAAAPYNLQLGLTVYIRATYLGIPYGLFYGTVKRVTPDISSRDVSLFCDDPVAGWDAFNEINIAASMSRSISAFRGAILDAIGEPAVRRSLTTNDYEADNPETGADQSSASGLLAALDQSTRTLGFIRYDPSPSVLFVYVTKTDYDLLTQASSGTIDDTITGASVDFLDTDIVTMQRVDYSLRVSDPPTTVWTSTEVPISLAAGATRTIWASFTDAVTGAALVSTSTGSPTITPTFFDQAAKIVITAGGAATVSALSVTGTAQRAVPASATYTGSSTLGTFVGADTVRFVSSPTIAASLAQRIVERHDGTIPRTSFTLTNIFPAAVARLLGDSVAVNIRRSRAAAYTGIVNRIDQTFSLGGAQWDTTIALEPRLVAQSAYFTLDTSALDGAAVMAT